MSADRGALSAESIQALFEQGCIRRPGGLDLARLQPCSLDLTLSAEAYRLPASILPLPKEPIRTLIDEFARRSIDLSSPQTLLRGKTYLIRLEESLHLPSTLGAYTNSKSSIGRLDVQTRTLCDGHPRFDKISRGYQGELFLEVAPRSFDIVLQQGHSLNQAIFYGRRRVLGTEELEALHRRDPLVLFPDGTPVPTEALWVDDGVMLSVDLSGDIVGWVARATTEEVSLLAGAQNPALEFFEPLTRPKDGRMLLRRGHFYILCTREFIRIPPTHAVEMLPYETTAGEFRAHYAGFFDPGFGWSPQGEGKGTPAVLEVRPYDDDLILRHGQPICKMAFEDLASIPTLPYGASGLRSHYQDQRGPRLSRYFQ